MTETGDFTAALARGPMVLDGGLSNELEARGHDLGGGLWHARLLRDAPYAVRAVHRAYYAVGAEVAITASYQATFEGFARLGIGRAETAALLARSVELARLAARDAADAGAGRRLWVAASVGPYGAMLADGSEYRGRYGLSVAELTRFHRPRIEALAEAGPDVFAVETIPDLAEAEAVLRALDGIGIPAWLSYSTREGRTCAGQPLAGAFALARGVAGVVAVGVNCGAPAEAAQAVRTAREATGAPGVVYPNKGWDASSGRWRDGEGELSRLVPGWLAAGARLVGGCCGVGPADIRAMAERIRSIGPAGSA